LSCAFGRAKHAPVPLDLCHLRAGRYLTTSILARTNSIFINENNRGYAVINVVAERRGKRRNKSIAPYACSKRRNPATGPKRSRLPMAAMSSFALPSPMTGAMRSSALASTSLWSIGLPGVPRTS
jgi:hypothetical protein